MPDAEPRDDPAKVRFEWVASFYNALNALVEEFSSKHRKEILSRVRGNILEVGVGTGNSFKDYPSGQQIVAIDISEEMLHRAEKKRSDYRGKIELCREDVESLSFKDEAFDTIFCSWVFCTVADPVEGLTHLRRVLKKDGQLLMLEHVRSKNNIVGYLMDKLNPLVARLGIGNINRDTVHYLRKVGFKIEQDRNIAYDIVKAIVASK